MRLSLTVPLLCAALLVVVLGPSRAEAGSFADGVYTSSLGYRITPPEGWKFVDRGNHGVMTEAMPGPLATAPATGYDVMFFDGTLEEADEGAPEPIYDSIIVVVVPSAPSEVSTASAGALAEAMKPSLQKLFPAAVTLGNATTAKHAGVDAIDLEWSVEGSEGGHKGVVLQTIVPADDHSVIVTCSADASRAEDLAQTCGAVIDSLKLAK